ncbi:hypothetical protein LY90DRAFT_509978 [Neocallimastix californiae]|uniref:Uncharacterized protein n=1 Tax=Neocallimastix californiae TaxID=1754190 RepID=A0A1Y2C630_9FUNG|nr:hypothetical protein LY90DRAFT_509978 [Neocallimastix californiae]|eukprot:ORY42396.1 hypothetical protein LY90DRAFT_509978 [Neocallimastix californiae]
MTLFYMSSQNGLEFMHQTIKNNGDMELIYISEFDKLIIRNDTNDIAWEMYRSKKKKKKVIFFISNDDDCNTLYSYSHLNITFDNVVFNPSILASRKVLIFISNFDDSSGYTHPNPNEFITSIEEIP